MCMQKTFDGKMKNGKKVEGKTYGALLTKIIKGEIKCSLKTLVAMGNILASVRLPAQFSMIFCQWNVKI